MSETKHTWTPIIGSLGHISRIEDESGKTICYGEIEEEPARLISAAPELLEALTDLLGDGIRNGSQLRDKKIAKAELAIQKATGEK